MVLQETETQVQTALSDTILTTFQKTIKYQTEFSVEGLIRVVVDKKDIYTFNINERIEKGKEVERLLSASSDSKSPTKRKRGRPRKSQKLAESESDEDAFDDFPGEQEDDDEEDLDDSGAKVGDEKTDEQNIVKQEPLGFDMAGGDGSQKQAEAGSQVFSQEDTALQLQQLALQLAGVSSDLAMQQPEIPASSAATPGTATDPSQPGASIEPELMQGTTMLILEAVSGEGEAVQNPAQTEIQIEGVQAHNAGQMHIQIEGSDGQTIQGQVIQGQDGQMSIQVGPPGAIPMDVQPLIEQTLAIQAQMGTGDHAQAQIVPQANNQALPTPNMAVQKHMCHVCEKSFFKAENLRDHINIHTGEKPYKCSHCDKVFFKAKTLQVHEKKHRGEQVFKCGMCRKVFLEQDDLKIHWATHMRPHRCEQCGRRFAQKETLMIHLNRYHVEAGDGGQLDKGDGLGSGKSRRVSYAERDKPYVCTYCGYKFPSQSGLTRHTRIHTGEKLYTCNYCNRGFVHQESLKRHERTHTGERPYKCDFCPKAFNQPIDLKRHRIRIHISPRPPKADDPTKPYKCAHCDKQFSVERSMRRHMRLHTGEKLFGCSYCSKVFVSFSGAERHVRIHVGEKPYKCDLCEHAFTQSGHLKRHRSSVHKIENISSSELDLQVTQAIQAVQQQQQQQQHHQQQQVLQTVTVQHQAIPTQQA